MDYALMTEPQIGGTYDQLLDLARWAEDAGLVSFARSDHLYSSREPRPDATEAFTTLAGLARETRRIRLCVLVTPVTFRHPAIIAKAAATIDQMSNGRLDLGIGTGWMELEHEAFGLPFPSWTERYERLEEAITYVRAAFDDDHARFQGRHYRIDAEVRPRPVGTRIVIGGSGARRTPSLAGRFADEYNHFVAPPQTIAPKIAVMREAAERAGRDPDEITVSVMGPVLGGVDEIDYRERLARRADERDVSPAEYEERLRSAGVPVGPPDRLAETIEGLESVGVSKLYLQWIDLGDRSGLEATYRALTG